MVLPAPSGGEFSEPTLCPLKYHLAERLFFN